MENFLKTGESRKLRAIGGALPSRFSAALVLLVGLSACAAPEKTGDVYDPYEEQNRRVHEGNRALDKALLRPVSKAYGNAIPEEVRLGVDNFASNLSVPGAIVNDLLQFNIEDAVHNTFRFLVNTTVGIGGIFDPAKQMGIEERDSDFGETLHVWGVGEGAYVELPVVGPSTSRDSVGMVVDFILDPVNHLLPERERKFVPLAKTASVVNFRYKFGTTVDSILYESEDSYAQSRLFYLENRRFNLGIEASQADEDIYDLYEEYAQ